MEHKPLLYTLTCTQQNEHCDWLVLGHVPLIKFKCILTGYNPAVVVRAQYNST